VKAVLYERYGGPDVLAVGEAPAPQPGPGQVLIQVAAAGVSRADTLQRQGFYPAPPGASPILGLEVAGTVVELGAGVTSFAAGDRVCALCAGGGYAQYAAVDAGQVLPVPEHWTQIEAATLPENGFTVFDNLFTRARLQAGETVLIHGGSSGIGTTAIMFAKAFGATPFVTVGTEAKARAAMQLGAAAAIVYRDEDFVTAIVQKTAGRGVDVVLDLVGGDYIARDIEALAPDGRVVCIATQGGAQVHLDLGAMMRKRATILASSLRGRSREQKAAIAEALFDRIWPLLPARDPIVPVIDSVYPFSRAAQAHERMEASAHIGKIVLVPDEESSP
jgi:putative PIG3 family NAD(P)H quinone oxidoreductase